MIADDQARAKIYRLLSSNSFVIERDDFVIDSLVDFEPMKRFKNMRDIMKPRCFRGGRSRRF